MEGDNANSIFVISRTAEEEAAEREMAQSGDPANAEGHGEPKPEPRGRADGDTAAEEVVGRVEGLIPLCVKHVSGPQLNTATFGYDIALMQKRPWAAPGAKLSDFFNYGFNEKSWRVYCAMQSEGEASLLSKANAMLRKLEAQAPRQAAEERHATPGPAAAAGAGGGGPMDGPMMMMAPGGGEDRGYGHDSAYPPPPHGASPPPPSSGHGMGPPPSSFGGYDGHMNAGPGREFRGRGRGGMGGGGRDGGGGFNAPNYKTKLCQRFAEGRCARGNDCNYAHGINDLRNAPSGATGPGEGGGGGGGYGGSTPGPSGGPQDGGDPQQPGMAGPPHGMSYYPPPQPYLMPPFQPGANMGPAPAMMMGGGGVEEGNTSMGGNATGFRMPPKRSRPDQGPGDIYEPQY